MPECTALITHYQTPELLGAAARSFKSWYPDTPVLIVDNGSRDGSETLLDELREEYPGTVEVMRLARNYFHGPALDLAIRSSVETEYVFTLDSDTETMKGGFLEPMIALLESGAERYSSGRVIRVNKRGFATRDGAYELCWIPYALFRRSLYLKLPPFEHHGVPNLRNGIAAARMGYTFHDFPVDGYVNHLGRGTADLYGYGLGVRGLAGRILDRYGL